MGIFAQITTRIPTMEKPFIYIDLDGVVADFAGAYKAAFNRSAYDDDPFTVQQFVMQIPEFFRILPVLEKGAELVDLLKEQYEVIFHVIHQDRLFIHHELGLVITKKNVMPRPEILTNPV